MKLEVLDMSAKSVKLQGVSKIFIDDHGNETYAVKHIDLEIEPGTFVTLLGPSGCGKTTTLRMIAGFDEASSGGIYFGDDKVDKIPPNKRDCTMVFQSYALFPHMTVFDNVAYGLKIKGMNKADINEKVRVMLDLMNLDEYRRRMPSQLSGGQQQRVALARALVMEPSVLLFDEPLSNLDATLRLTMRDEIRRLQKRLGITTIYVTHDQSEAMSMSDIIIVMNKGSIEQLGTPQEIYQHPKTKFVADFIGTANFLNGHVISTEGQFIEVELEQTKDIVLIAKSDNFAVGDHITVVVRPEAIKLGHGSLNGTVSKSAFMGQTQEYEVKYGQWNIAVTVSNPANEQLFDEWSFINMELPTDSLHAIKS
jgi:iron(III) transport system ATP-binding protein